MFISGNANLIKGDNGIPLQVPRAAENRASEAFAERPAAPGRLWLPEQLLVLKTREAMDLPGRVEDSAGPVRNGVIIHLFIPEGEKMETHPRNSRCLLIYPL